MRKGTKQTFKMSPRELLFCRYYLFGCSNDKQDVYFTIGNATRSYAMAYGKYLKIEEEKVYNQCGFNASMLLKKDKITTHLTKLLNDNGMNDLIIDSRLMQIAVNASPKTAVEAIKEYNKLKMRILEKVDVTSGGKPIPILGGISNVQIKPGDPKNRPDGQ